MEGDVTALAREQAVGAARDQQLRSGHRVDVPQARVQLAERAGRHDPGVDAGTAQPLDVESDCAPAPDVGPTETDIEAFPDTFNPGYFLIKFALALLALLVLLQALLDAFGDGEREAS